MRLFKNTLQKGKYQGSRKQKADDISFHPLPYASVFHVTYGRAGKLTVTGVYRTVVFNSPTVRKRNSLRKRKGTSRRNGKRAARRNGKVCVERDIAF
jgi:hypothetical protein